MYKIEWDKETGGVILNTRVTNETLGIAPRPVFYEELDLLGLDKLGWTYPHTEAPLMWAVNKQYYYRGQRIFEVHPTFRVMRQSWSAYNLSSKYRSSLNPYAALFKTFILLLIPSTFPVDI